jgi:DNA-binding NarL/FixJ family response regulator
MKENTIQIAIADDHTAIRQSLVSILSLQPSFLFILEAENGEDLLNKLYGHQPDVLLLDIKMPGMSGIQVLKIIQSQYPNIRVLILSAFFDEVCVAQCLEYGINGYLTKSMEIDEIIKAIKLAYNNEVYLNNLLSNTFLKKYLVKHKKSNNILPCFSDEEIRILNLLKDEKTTEEISACMHVSKRTIETKRDKMREKVHAKTTGGLLLYAFKTGVID